MDVEKKIRRGEPLQHPPYGYVMKDRTFRPSPNVRHVRTIFRMYNTGSTLADIAEHLNEQGVPTARGGTWAGSQISKILHNEAYVGILNFGEHRYRGNYDPLVSWDQWRKAQLRMERRAAKHPRNLDASLSSCFICGVCGGRVIANVSDGRRYYLCADQRNMQIHPDERVHASELAANAIVWTHVQQLLDRSAGAPEELRRLNGAIAAARSREDVDRQQEILERITHPIEIGSNRTLTIRVRWPMEPAVYSLPVYYSETRGSGLDLAKLRIR